MQMYVHNHWNNPKQWNTACSKNLLQLWYQLGTSYIHSPFNTHCLPFPLSFTHTLPLSLTRSNTHTHLCWAGIGFSIWAAWPATGIWYSTYCEMQVTLVLWIEHLAGIWSWICHSWDPSLYPFLLVIQNCCITSLFTTGQDRQQPPLTQ